jgi:hypothetical protein
MPSLKMTDFSEEERRAVYGSALDAQDLTSKKREVVIRVAGRRGKRSMAETEVLIRNFILGAEAPVTMLQICDAIGRVPAPHFRKIVDDLVKAGVVVKASDVGPGVNLPRFWYWHP